MLKGVLVLIKKKCNDCSEDFMSLIVNGNLPDDNIVIWHFYYKKCLRSWRKRGFENKGYSQDEINNIILREYP